MVKYSYSLEGVPNVAIFLSTFPGAIFHSIISRANIDVLFIRKYQIEKPAFEHYLTLKQKS